MVRLFILTVNVTYNEYHQQNVTGTFIKLYGWKVWLYFQYIFISSTNMKVILLIFEISTVYSLECINLKYEKKQLKDKTLDAYLQNLHTFEFLWRSSQVSIGPKVLVIGPFSILRPIYFQLCLIICYELYYDYLVENESVIFLSQNGKYIIF